jgi:hypothetical protein
MPFNHAPLCADFERLVNETAERLGHKYKGGDEREPLPDNAHGTPRVSKRLHSHIISDARTIPSFIYSQADAAATLAAALSASPQLGRMSLHQSEGWRNGACARRARHRPASEPRVTAPPGRAHTILCDVEVLRGVMDPRGVAACNR